MLWCWTNYQLDLNKILAYGNIMNKKQIFIFVMFLTSFDLQMTFKWPFSMTNQKGSKICEMEYFKFWYLICWKYINITEFMIKKVTPTPIFPLFLLSHGNSIWLPRWPLSRPIGHELARGTKKLVKFSTSGFQKCELKKRIMRVRVSPPFLPD